MQSPSSSPHGVTGITGHAAFRYRDRLDRRCADPELAVYEDLARGLRRETPPRWMFLSEPGDFYVSVAADEHGPDRVYVIRDTLAITLLVRPDTETETRQRNGSRHRDRRRNNVKGRRAPRYA